MKNKRNKLLSGILTLLLWLPGIAQQDLQVLNQYQYLVIKPINNHVNYREDIGLLIRGKFIERGFRNILSESEQYNSTVDPCNIITCEFNLRSNAGSSSSRAM